MEFLNVPCWVLCYIHCIHSHWVTLQDLVACLIFYADDTQLYLSFETSSAEDLAICKSTTEDYIREIDLWMVANKLKLNSNKTEILVFSSSYCPRPALNNLDIASETVDCSITAKNIGVIFNNSLPMLPHVTVVCNSSFFHLRNIFKIRKFLC